ncbi:uncharacterized protein PgNI_07333, partial [Pyricularia grisea]|uniref:Uncharacterized protein n=1 Tax=Pyricularia grisea TaxID=148305 RepID=A0A6P8B0Z3_PYRGI
PRRERCDHASPSCLSKGKGGLVSTWIVPFIKEAGGVSKTNNRATSSRHKTTIVSLACFFPCLLFSVMSCARETIRRGKKIAMLRKTMSLRMDQWRRIYFSFPSSSSLLTDGISDRNLQVGTKKGNEFPSRSHTVTWKRSRCISNLRTVKEALYQVRASARQVKIWVATMVCPFFLPVFPGSKYSTVVLIFFFC